MTDKGQRARQRARKAAGVTSPPCGGTKRDGTPCGSFAVEGGDRCSSHGGRRPIKPGQIPPTLKTGGRSLYFRHMTEEGRRIIGQMERDPKLLNVRAPVAASAFLVGEIMVEPTPDAVLRMAAAIFGVPDEFDGKLITELFRPEQVVQARQVIIERAHRVLAAHAKIVTDASKSEKIQEALQYAMLPALQNLAGRLQKLAVKHIPNPEVRQAFLADLRDSVQAAVAEAAEAASAESA